MKYLAGFFVPLLFINNLFASNLCDSSCDLSITFPGGGSIEAVEALTITFGEGGYVNDGSAITGFSAGDSLSLEALEAINFQADGEFNLGQGGNIDYSEIQILSKGVVELAAVGTGKKVLIQDVTLLGVSALHISSDFKVVESGTLHIHSDADMASTDMTITNHNLVSAYFGFDSATLSFDNETIDDITDLVLIESGDDLKMTFKEAVIEPISVSEAGGATSVAEPASGASVAGGSAGGLVNLLSLFVISGLLLTLRLKSVRCSR